MKFKWGENTAFRLLALFLAFVLWVYVTHQNNPVVEQAARVSLEHQDLPASMIVEEIPQAVSVYYRSSRGRLALVGSGEFTARVNLSGLAAGVHSLPVQVGAPEGVEIIRVNPQTVTVSLDSMVEKNIPVLVNVTGTPAPGFERSDPAVAPAVIKATGPSRLLREIKNITVDLDIKGARTGIERVLPVSVGIKGVELQPKSVKVTLPVEALPFRNVQVSPRVTGSPAEGFVLDGLTVEPETVQISGDGQILAGTGELPTAPIDISGASANVTAMVRVITPGQVSAVTPAQVKITAIIIPEESAPPDDPDPPPGDVEVGE